MPATIQYKTDSEIAKDPEKCSSKGTNMEITTPTGVANIDIPAHRSYGSTSRSNWSSSPSSLPSSSFLVTRDSIIHYRYQVLIKIICNLTFSYNFSNYHF